MSTTIYLGGVGSTTPLTELLANNTYTISFQVDQTIYPHSTYPNQWFTLGPSLVVTDGDINLSGSGSMINDTNYRYNGGNSFFDADTNTMYVTFELPSFGTTLSEQYSTSFTLAPGDLYIRAYVAVGDYSSIPTVVNYKVPQAVAPAEPIVCFKEDSKILTDEGYVAVQNLKPGHLVKTLKNGYVPVVMIGSKEIRHIGSESRIKDQLYKCSKNKYPELLQDLVVTGCHSILVDKFASDEQRNRVIEINGDTYVTDNKYRLPAAADDRTSVYEVVGKHKIYHFALENSDYYTNYGVYANGLLVETCSIRNLKEMSGMKLLL